ncbi:MAG: hypothetical protein ACJ0E8_02315 [Gammaproteobacteria bacterium]
MKKYDSLGFIETADINISFKDILEDFTKAFSENNNSKSSAVKVLEKYLPDFNHLERGKNLDQKM